MVESTEKKQEFTEKELEDMDDDTFEAHVKANTVKRSQEEIDEDVESFLAHPINCKKLSPDMLE